MARLCPPDFTILDTSGRENPKGCYYISTTRQNWENAKFECESKNAKLISVESFTEKKYVLEYLLTLHYLHIQSVKVDTTSDVRYEYWTSGSDMIQEAKWLWGRSRKRVGDVGWLRERKPESDTENCLSWSIILKTVSQVKEGWVSSWCLKKLLYICELNL